MGVPAKLTDRFREEERWEGDGRFEKSKQEVATPVAGTTDDGTAGHPVFDTEDKGDTTSVAPITPSDGAAVATVATKPTARDWYNPDLKALHDSTEYEPEEFDKSAYDDERKRLLEDYKNTLGDDFSMRQFLDSNPRPRSYDGKGAEAAMNVASLADIGASLADILSLSKGGDVVKHGYASPSVYKAIQQERERSRRLEREWLRGLASARTADARTAESRRREYLRAASRIDSDERRAHDSVLNRNKRGETAAQKQRDRLVEADIKQKNDAEKIETRFKNSKALKQTPSARVPRSGGSGGGSKKSTAGSINYEFYSGGKQVSGKMSAAEKDAVIRWMFAGGADRVGGELAKAVRRMRTPDSITNVNTFIKQWLKAIYEKGFLEEAKKYKA